MAAITKSKGPWARLLWNKNPIYFLRNLSSLPVSRSQIPHSRKPILEFIRSRPSARFFSSEQAFFAADQTVRELLADVEREKQREREEKKKAGVVVADDEDDEDYMGVGPLIEKLEKKKVKDSGDFDEFEEPTDSDSDEDDERFSPDAIEKQANEFEKKFKKHEDLLKNFVESETVDDAYKWMKEIDRFEQKHLRLQLEYRVIGELLNRLKEATGKDRFMLLQKLNRSVRLVEWKEAYDPNNPANYGVIQQEEVPSVDLLEDAGIEEERHAIPGVGIGDDGDEDFSDMKEKDDILLEKINAIDKKLEEKLAELDCTFGKKGKLLEEEIRDLAEERHELTEKKRRPLYRKGFDVKLINVNRTCKVTKGGQVVKYTAMLACGNYHGVVGFAKGKGPAIPIALQKAYEKCFQNLHYVERYEEHTIAHAIQTKYKQTKVYLWPAPTRTGMKASRTVETILHLAGFKNVKSKVYLWPAPTRTGMKASRTVETILHLAGFKNVKSKVIGSRNPHNTVKALFKALNAIETPKDVQEKFGRTVVESYLL